MRTLLFPLFLLSVLAGPATAQDSQPCTLFDGKGRRVSVKQLERQAARADVVLFGELHNNPIAHWLQVSLARRLAAVRPLTIGMEMLETDNQDAVGRYLRGEVDSKGLDTLARLWVNHRTDYAPLIDFAKERGIAVVASNVPRRFASMVYRHGFSALDTLQDTDRAYLPPLPIAYDPSLPGYQRMLAMGGGHGGDNLPKAQALKDATMAHSILRHWQPGQLMYHLNGAYHSDYREGIAWYLLAANPSLRILTISTVTQMGTRRLEKGHLGKADFILCVDADVPGSY